MVFPAEVLTAAAELVAEFGPRFLRLGERGGMTYFSFSFPDGLPMGFPIVYTYEKREKVRGNNGGGGSGPGLLIHRIASPSASKHLVICPKQPELTVQTEMAAGLQRTSSPGDGDHLIGGTPLPLSRSRLALAVVPVHESCIVVRSLHGIAHDSDFLLTSGTIMKSYVPGS